jgi:hypothetical protein
MPQVQQSETSAGGKRKALRKPVAILVFCICALYLGTWSYSRYKIYRVERLIQDVQQLKVGVTSDDELRRFSVNHGGDFYLTAHRKLPAADEVEASVWISVLSASLRFRDRVYSLPVFGQREWAAQVILDERDGHLVKSFFGIAITRSDGVQLEGFATLGIGPFIDGHPYHVSDAYVTGPPAEFLGVQIGPDASKDEKQRGLNFNFGCLARLNECRHVCEVMPSAWNDLPNYRRVHYPDGRELVIDAECRQALGPNP